jgi:hypothetical protein
MVWSLGFRILGFKVQDVGLRVEGCGLRIEV